jgi:heterodisulfide reductase subunit C
MDILPNQIIRLVQLGQEEAALGAETIWYCAACLSCSARCPKGIDLARVMEALRDVAMDKCGDHITIAEIPLEDLADWPQQAFVGAFRKYTR